MHFSPPRFGEGPGEGNRQLQISNRGIAISPKSYTKIHTWRLVMGNPAGVRAKKKEKRRKKEELRLAAKASDTATASAGAAMDTQMPGCDDMVGAMDSESPNLCAEHCKQGNQSDQASTLTVPVALLTALYTTTPALPGKAPPRPTAATLSALVAASPPHAILHCVYRI